MVVLSMIFTLISATLLFFGLGRQPEKNPDFGKPGTPTTKVEYLHFWSVVRRASSLQAFAGFLTLIAVCIFADMIVQLGGDAKFERFDFKIGGGFVSGILSFVVSRSKVSKMPPLAAVEGEKGVSGLLLTVADCCWLLVHAA
jgi:hypothetical protein